MSTSFSPMASAYGRRRSPARNASGRGRTGGEWGSSTISVVGGEGELVARLRAGDEQAFATLVERYHAPMLRLAATFVPSTSVAEEVVQDTWLGVVRGIDRFEGRSSFKTWLFHILVNRARTAGSRERRSPAPPKSEPVAPRRFGPEGHWIDPPAPWSDEVEDRLVAGALAGRIRELMDQLPPSQRQVVVMRDIEGCGAQDVCQLLDISEANQRVLLHRGRARLRALLEPEVGRV